MPEGSEALTTIAAFRLALPRTTLRHAGAREPSPGDSGVRDARRPRGPRPPRWGRSFG
ncbi:hypothetical protein ACFQX6_51420 [Streptosporangium lutulentum]